MSTIIPAILVESRRELDEALWRLRALPEVRTIQIDVVDGRFASPASWPYTEGAEVPETAPSLGEHCFEVDLMALEPETVVDEWLALGAARLTLHLESMRDPGGTLARIKERHGHDTAFSPCPFELGLALSMTTDIKELEPFVEHIDYVQLMGIDTIGKQGQPFDSAVLARVAALKKAHPELTVQVDGGVTEEHVGELLAAGASRLVVGHAITLAEDPAGALKEFSEAAKGGGKKRHARSARGETLTDTDITALAEKANEIRQTIIEMLIAAGSGHTAGPLGMADIFTALYFNILNHDPKNPEWEERDRLVLSNGHICPVRYATMAHAGYFPVEECVTLRTFGTRLQGHPERLKLPGLETTSGPLGEGLAQAAGMAYALRMDGKKNRVYCVVSDGEQDEGNTWEAAMFAGKYKLAGLTAIMDRNNIQIDGMTENIMPLEPIADKYRAFNWHVLEVGGHDFREFIAAVEQAKGIFEKPTVIIAHTIPGKGIKEIEFDYRWHGSPPGAGPEDVWKKADQGKAMLAELRTLGGRITSEHQ